MSKRKEYKAMKNYIHNELGLTKEDIVKELRPLLKEYNTYGVIMTWKVGLDKW